VLRSPVRILVLLASAAMAVYFAVAIGGRTVQLYQMQVERVQLEQELAILRAEEQALLGERDRLVQYQDIESIARRDLNLIKPGETAVIVYPAFASPDPAPAPPTPIAARPEPSWLERLFSR